MSTYNDKKKAAQATATPMTTDQFLRTIQKHTTDVGSHTANVVGNIVHGEHERTRSFFADGIAHDR